jgi:hypothetical protein
VVMLAILAAEVVLIWWPNAHSALACGKGD